jgi:hypothetical protein
MPTINKPTPVDVNTPAPTPIGPLDRAPAPVDVGTPAPTPIGPLDRAPAPVVSGPGLGVAAGNPVPATLPVQEAAVEPDTGSTVPPNIVLTVPSYIEVLLSGNTVVQNATAIDFTGLGVTASANGTVATVAITSGGTYGNSNVSTLLAGFGSNTISTTGNVTAGYVFGNGSQLTGITTTYGNSNVTTLLASLGANTISGTGNITTTANISGGFILGNGSQLTGIAASYGNANVVANLAALGSNPISTTGNITGGNIMGGANVNATTHTGTTVSVSANVTGGNITTAGLIVTTGNVSGGNVIAATLVQSATVSASGNVTGGNILTGGLISATGNITGGNVLGGANVNATTHTGTTVSVTANITGGNILTGGLISATGNITGGNLQGTIGDILNVNSTNLTVTNILAPSAGNVVNIGAGGNNNLVVSNVLVQVQNVPVSVVGNVTGGNILTAGIVSATGNVSGNFFIGNGSQLTGINNSFAGEMHVSKNGNDSTGTGNILQPYLTITHALTQVAGGRNTVVIHPGTYTENPTITSQATQLITYDATGASTLVAGTVTIANVTGRIAGLKMTNLAITGNAQAYINSSTVDEQFTKSSSGYVEVDDCELQVTGNVLISGSGSISIVGNKINNLVVNNAGAAVLVKGADDCVMPQVTAGSLNIVDSVIRASSNTANAVTASAGTVVTLMNNQIVTPAADSVARVSIAGYHSIISLVYDKANSTLSNSLNSVVYFQTANVDSLVSSGNITGGNLVTGGLISATGNITGGNISTGVITLTNGAVIRDTAGDAVAFGQNAGASGQAAGAVAIGVGAGQTTQQLTAVAVGDSAGYNTQGLGAVGVGAAAGFNLQGEYAVALGYYAGNTSQGNNSVAIGFNAGSNTQGTSAVAIGFNAGRTSQGNNSIILNATSANLDQTTANTFTVAPVRNDVANIAEVMFYNATSKEITYGNTISVAANITGGNLITAGQVTATGNVSGDNLNVTGNIVDTGALSIITGSNGNIALAPNGTGNVTVSSNISITGNTATITSANLQIGYLEIPQISLAANVTANLTVSGKHYYSTSASNLALTLADNSTVSWPVGTAITIVNAGTASILINQGTGVSMYQAGNATAGNRVLATFGMATIMNTAANTWFINGTGLT